MLHSASRLLKTTLPLIATLSLSACAGLEGGFSAAPASKSGTTNPCGLLPVQEYTPEYNAELASEVQAAPLSAVWPKAVADYASLRDAIKGCIGTTIHF